MFYRGEAYAVIPTHPVRDISLVYGLVLVLAALGRLSGLWTLDRAVATRPC